ncbi:DUF2158 domain-containing protein [Variovorax humicola]|uniref:DUF2158 domain-containing protein n=1 Tax=Variovorax humicola TaxID=1769758 RepID=A0ABU8VXT7_9BURK
MAKFNTGDLVKLKSGGPVMTVDSYEKMYGGDQDKPRVFCKWFAGSKAEQNFFHEQTLALHTDDAPKK